MLLARHGGITDGLHVTSTNRPHIHELRTPHEAQLRQPVASREVQADRLHLALLQHSTIAASRRAYSSTSTWIVSLEGDR